VLAQDDFPDPSFNRAVGCIGTDDRVAQFRKFMGYPAIASSDFEDVIIATDPSVVQRGHDFRRECGV
jgi:hypothetical protein